MREAMKRLVPQPLTAVVMCSLALAVLWGAWSGVPFSAANGLGWQTAATALGLAVAVVIAGLYPIHIQYRTKVLLTTPPLFVAATLLPPGVAALTAGLSFLTLEVVTREKKGSLPSDIATATGRWVIVAYASSCVAHLCTDGNGAGLLTLLGAALVMFAGDIFTSAFEIAPMSGDPPLRVMLQSLQGAGLIEIVQYLLGLAAALTARQHIGWLLLWIVPTAVLYAIFKHTHEMYASTRQLLEDMADAVDLRDPYTGNHSRRVAQLSLDILQELNVKGAEAELIYVAARVHDIGKMGVSDAILNKPGRLTAEEKRLMETHADRGAELIAGYPDFARGKEIVRHHHERWDGQGYPGGLKGLDIPFGARLIAVADSFDAMTSDRPYRAALSVSQATHILSEDRAKQWDPALVDALLRHFASTTPKVAPAMPRAAPTTESVFLTGTCRSSNEVGAG
jgi:putative nucleotidyltransferase with HDIG domain